MALKSGAELVGFGELDRALRELTRPAQRGVMQRAALKAAQPLLDAVRSNAPVDEGTLRDSFQAVVLKTGRLSAEEKYVFRQLAQGGGKEVARAGIRALRGGSGRSETSVTVRVGTSNRYAGIVEFGSMHMSARWYFGQALDATRVEIVRTCQRELKTEIDKAAKRAARKAARQKERQP